MSARREDIDDSDVQYMYDVKGMTQQDIAEYYGVSDVTIYYRLHPEKVKELNNNRKEAKREWQQTDKAKLHKKEWRESEEGKAYMSDYMKEYRLTEKFKEWLKEYQQTDKFKEYQQSDKRKDVRRKANAFHRELCFIPLNDTVENGEWHHIDEVHVISIPKELHKGIYHNLKTGQGMEEVNTIAFRYIAEDTFDKLLAGEI